MLSADAERDRGEEDGKLDRRRNLGGTEKGMLVLGKTSAIVEV